MVDIVSILEGIDIVVVEIICESEKSDIGRVDILFIYDGSDLSTVEAKSETEESDIGAEDIIFKWVESRLGEVGIGIIGSRGIVGSVIGSLCSFPSLFIITKYIIAQAIIRINITIVIIIIIFFFLEKFPDSDFFGFMFIFSIFEIVCCILSKESVWFILVYIYSTYLVLYDWFLK